MKSNAIIFAALGTAGLVFGAPSALAGTILSTYANSADFGAGSVGYEVGSITPNPNSTSSPVGVGIGGDSFTTMDKSYSFSSTGQFNTWCVDIYHWAVGGSVTYTVQTGANLASNLDRLRGGTGTVRVAALQSLANEVYKSVDTEVESAAFQLAVWAITYGAADASGHYHVGTTDAGFNVDSGTAGSSYAGMANSWLAALGTAPDTGNYQLTYLYDNPETQNMVVFTSVPEPGTLGLAGLAIAGAGFMARRRRPRSLA